MVDVQAAAEIEFGKTEEGTIPTDWDCRRLNSVVLDLISGDWGQETDSQTQDLTECYVVRGTDFAAVQSGWLGNIPLRYVKPTSAEKRRLYPDALLIEISGGSKNQPTGRILRVTEAALSLAQRPMLFTNFVKQIRIDSSVVSAPFFQLYWDYLYSLGKTRVYEKRTTGIRNFKFRDFLAEEDILLPSLPEQRRIAAVLNAIQDAIAAQEDVIAEAHALKRSLMQRLFTYGPGRAPAETKETEIGEIPAHWKTTPLRELCVNIVDCPHTTPNFKKSGVLTVRNFNIRDGQLQLQDSYYTSEKEYLERIRRLEPQAGDVLFSREAPIGEACLIPHGQRLSLGQRTMLFRPDPGKLNGQFLVYAFYSAGVQNLMQALGKGVTAKHLNVGDVRTMSVPVAPMHEQDAIATMVSALDSKIAVEEDRKVALQDLFRSALHQLMTGQIRLLSDEGEPRQPTI